MSSELEIAYEKAEELYSSGKRDDALVAFKVLATEDLDVEADDVDSIRFKELSIYRYAELLCARKKADELVELINQIRPLFGVLPKAKTAKVVRRICDQISAAGASLEKQEKVCTEMVEWARGEKLTYLRHRLQLRHAQVYYDQRDSIKALALLASLIRELRKLDDRALMVDCHLVESKVYYSIRNVSKSRASLVAARTTSNAIYCPPLAQAEIDLQSGILHNDEGDHKTAFSYLYEAFEGFHQLGDHAMHARRAMLYMLLAKISCDNHDELKTVMSSKSVLEYTGRDVEALQSVARAYKNKDTHDFNQILKDYKDILTGDQVIEKHLNAMFDTLLEKHMLKVIQPYNRVQIAYIAESMKLEIPTTEARLSQMILDKKLLGIVDQQHQCLVVFEEEPKVEGQVSLYEDSLKTLETFDKLVTAMVDKMAGKFDHLVEKSKEEKKKKDAKDKEKQEKLEHKGNKDEKKEDEKKEEKK